MWKLVDRSYLKHKSGNPVLVYCLVSFYFLWRREKTEERRPERRGEERRERRKEKKNELKDMFTLSFNGKSLRWVMAANRVNQAKC
jgi:hypothetical protein